MVMSIKNSCVLARFIVLLVLGGSGAVASAEEPGSRSGHGHTSVSFQVIRIDGFESSIGLLPIGTTDTQSVNFDVEYNVTDRITISAGLPYVRKRYNGAAAHDPLTLDPPRPEVENVDTGSWNTDFQDFHLGIRYLLRDGPIMVQPYVFLGVPSNNYPFFGHAAVGQGVLKVDVGSTFAWFPGLSDAYYQLDLGYVFVEETLNTNISHWLIRAEGGYFFNDTVTGRVFAQLKKGHGLTFPDDFPTPRTSEKWYQHDRLVKHNYLNAGIGLDWSLNSKYRLESSVITMIWAEQVHDMEYAITLGLSRSF